MANAFYCDFDTEIIGKARTSDDIRGPFQHDRDRIIHTSAFRRLQAKTQVFRSGEYDPFCGSGSTLIAAQQLNRYFLGIELNESYFKLAKRRLDGSLERN